MNIYLNDEELDVIRRVATELGVTNAYVVRLALRSVFGLSVGPSGEDEVRHIVSGHVQNLTGAG